MEGRDVQRFLVGNLRERELWGDPNVDGRINYKMDGGQRCAQGSGGKPQRKETTEETPT
jgi:hypothetical protein